MNPHVSVITLGVRDLDRAKRFYSGGPRITPLLIR
jgi:catechol 2,3-dioxygenase-like lactoylglutathione lyase family enzyme